MKVYRVGIFDHLSHLWTLLLFAIVLPFAVYHLALFKLGYYRQEEAFAVGSVTFLILAAPHILLHFDYYLNNRGDSFEVGSSGKSFVYNKGTEGELKFTTRDIKSFVCFKSRPLAEERMHVFSWDAYHYALITLKSGEKIKVSSLLIYEMDKVIKFQNIEVRKTFYAWMS